MTSDQERELIINVIFGEATEEERQLFQKWLDSDSSHLSIYKEMQEIYIIGCSLSTSPKQWIPEETWENIKTQIENNSRKKYVYFRKMATYAATIVFFLSAGIWFFSKKTDTPVITKETKAILVLANGHKVAINNKNIQLQQNDIQVSNDPSQGLKYVPQATPAQKALINHLIIPKGSDYQLVLADGTKVWLNSESELSYPTYFEGNKREVNLKGEAYFEVVKNPDCPFYVHTDLLAVKVYGTQFNVSSYPDDKTMKTTLVEGSVGVIRDGQEVRIKPSEQLVYDKTTGTSEINTVDTNLYIQWRTGKYYFNNLELTEIMAQVQRWYNLNILFESEDLKHHRFSGAIYKPNRIEYSLDIIGKATDLKFKIKGNTIYIAK